MSQAFAERIVEVEGRAIRCRERGEGEPLVCIDGLMGMRPSQAHALMAERRRVIVFGFPDQEYAAPAEVGRRLGAAVLELGIDRFDLMGHGAGAAVALWLALAKPQSVRSVALVAPTALSRDRHPIADLKAALYAHPERHSDPPAARVRPIQADPGGGLERRLGEIKHPVLALFGTNDPIAPPELGERYRTALADCNLMFVYDAAHAIDIDRPEAVAFIGLEFLERQDLFLVNRDSGITLP